MSKKNINKLNPLHYFKIGSSRKKHFKEGSLDSIREENPIKALAKKIHPLVQHVVVSDIKVHSDGSKTFSFVPNANKGTTSLAYFAAGQYVSVFLNINGKYAPRAYSLCSSPKESLEGLYQITVKPVEGGLASTYLLNEIIVGDELEISGPAGHFDYVGLRDAKNVICIAGGSGITPFLSMAKAINDGDEDFEMTLLYGSRKESAILFKDEFEEMAKNPKIKVIHVLSDEEKEGFEHGFIDAALIKKYAPSETYSIFVAGPQKMYDFLEDEIAKLDIEKKYVRYELYGEIHDPTAFKDHPDCAIKDVTIKVHIMDEIHVAKGNSNETVMQIIERNGISIPSRCRSGECGWCHSFVIAGDYYVPSKLDYRRKADHTYNCIHPCCTFPLSDMEIEVQFSK